MVQLRRRSGPLLSTISGVPRSQWDASQQQQKAQSIPSSSSQPAPSSPVSVEDVERSPESSDLEERRPGDAEADDHDDVEVVSHEFKTPAHKSSASSRRSNPTSSPLPPPSSGSSSRGSKRKSTEDTTASSRASKRARGGDKNPTSSGQSKEDGDSPFANSWQWSQKSARGTQNTYSKSSQRATYGSGGGMSSSAGKAVRNLSASKMTPIDEQRKTASQPEQRKRNTFNMPDMPVLDADAGYNKANFQVPDGEPPGSAVTSTAAEDFDRELAEDDDDERPVALRGDDEDDLAAGKTKCPLCGTRIKRSFLDVWNEGRKLRWRDKEAFCTAHRRVEAESTITDKGWPKVDWAGLESRFAPKRATLKAILDGTKDSHFRNALADRQAQAADEKREREQRRRQKKGAGTHDKDSTSGRANINAAGQEIEVPGYYGSRGGKRMMDWLGREFRSRLGALRTEDAILRDAGRAMFVQAVLVPELATLLIMEDLDCDQERAREVLRESAEVGELVNAEEEEQLARPMSPDDERESAPTSGKPEFVDLS